MIYKGEELLVRSIFYASVVDLCIVSFPAGVSGF